MNLQRREEDKEFKRESLKRNSNIGTPSPYENKEMIQITPKNDDFISSNNNTPIINNKLPDKYTIIEQFNYEPMKNNKNFISKELIKNMKNNEDLLNNSINNSTFNQSNNNIGYNQNYELNQNDERKKNVFNVNINPNVNLFNFPLIKSGQSNQMNNMNNYSNYDNSSNNYSSIFKQQQQ